MNGSYREIIAHRKLYVATIPFTMGIPGLHAKNKLCLLHLPKVCYNPYMMAMRNIPFLPKSRLWIESGIVNVSCIITPHHSVVVGCT